MYTVSTKHSGNFVENKVITFVKTVIYYSRLPLIKLTIYAEKSNINDNF